MTRQDGEALAIEVLGWLAQDDERLGAFLDLAGADATDLRARAAEPDFLGFVLDFLLQDEAALVAFCDQSQWEYTDPMRLRATLPGGPGPHWT